MSQITNIEKIFEIMEREKMRCYTVVGADRNLMFKNMDVDITIAEAINRLRSDLKSVEGLVTVKINEKPANMGGNTRNFHTFEIVLGTAQANAPQQQINGVGGLSREDVDRAVQENTERLLIQFQKDQEIERLKRELKEAKEGSPLDNIIGSLAPILMQKFGGGAPAIAGVTDTPEQTDQAMQRQQINQAFNRLVLVDPNFAEHITLLADLAENNPQMYKMAINQLKNA